MDIVLPGGGYVMTMFQAHFDESYEGSRCGRLNLQADKAKDLDGRWRAVPYEYGFPFFQMVASKRGGVFLE